MTQGQDYLENADVGTNEDNDIKGGTKENFPANQGIMMYLSL